MANDVSRMVAKAASVGLMCGALAACRGSSPPAEKAAAESASAASPVAKASAATPTAEVAAAEGKQCCKGLNDCKGKGGCATDKNSCMGKNECKGKGGCNMHCPK